MAETATRYLSPLLRFPCPACGAEVGAHCRAKSGRVTYDAHAARYKTEGDYWRAPCGVDGHDHSRAYCDGGLA